MLGWNGKSHGKENELQKSWELHRSVPSQDSEGYGVEGLEFPVTDICIVIMPGGQWKAACWIILFFTAKNSTTKVTIKTQFQPSLCFFVSMRQILNMKSNPRVGYHTADTVIRLISVQFLINAYHTSTNFFSRDFAYNPNRIHHSFVWPLS